MIRATLLLMAGGLLTGCRLEMHDQPKRDAFQASAFFKNGAASRSLLPGTIPRGELRTNELFFAGLRGTNLVEELPVALTRELIERGRERFNIYCAVCHGADGGGGGMIVQRGFPRPPSFHTKYLREVPIGHIYRVISDGYGIMFPYGSRVAPADRWAVAAYVRTLQLSASIHVADLKPEIREELERSSR